MGEVHDKLIELRRKSETLLREKNSEVNGEGLSSGPELPDAARVSIELETLQLELENQIDELLHLQHELDQARSFYTEFYDFAPVGYLTLDTKGKILNANLTFAEMLSMRRRDIIGRPLSAYISYDGQDLFYLHMKSAVNSATRKICELRLKNWNGKTLDVQLESLFVRDSLEDTRQLRTVISDITERKFTEKQLKESYTRFQLLYEQAPVSYQSLDKEGIILDVNPFWLELLGYSREEVIGKSFGKFLHPEWKDHFCKTFPKFKAVGEVLGVNFEIVKKDGSTIFVELYGKIGKDEHGGFQETHCIFHDITRRYQAELEREKMNELLERKVQLRTRELEEMNTALKVLIKKGEEDRKEIDDNIHANVKSMLFPLIKQLGNTLTKRVQRELLAALESGINEMASPFSQKLSDPIMGLTPTEIQVAKLVREGKSTKEIAEMLTKSIRAVSAHRESIRQKLELTNKKKNLRTYLIQLDQN